MKRLDQLLQIAVAMLVLGLSVPAFADGGRVPKPDIPEAVKGSKCVEPVEVMRHKHFDFLLRHRDKTMHKGIRTKKFSLRQCLQCHASAEPTAQREEQGHFCKNCHEYAGVRIDCFECHATHPPADGATASFHPLVTPNMEAMRDVEQSDSAALLNKLADTSTKKETGAAQ